MKQSKLTKFQDDIFSIDKVMTSQIIRHDVKFDDIISLSKMSALLRIFVDFFTLLDPRPLVGKGPIKSLS